MDSNQDYENQDVSAVEIDNDGAVSIEDFIRQLEAREKDLHISPDLDIEVEGADFDDTNPPDFIRSEFNVGKHIEIEPIRATNLVPNNKTFSDLEDEVELLRTKLEKAENDRAEMTSTMRRRQFDFENYRKRTERERDETFLNQLSNLAGQMLPVIDNMDRALVFAEKHSDGKSSDFHEFFRGIALVSQQLNEVLAEMGIFPILAVGEPFDPNFHEAVAAEPRSDVPQNTVTSELLRGYRIGTKVIRAAMVRVAVAPRTETPAEIQQPSGDRE
ncbi:MAG: nucleotide exchange factor GrpE [Acidobacteria bacterium]|nr:nucleotide exchange factor GrpE [Acidobacteriota bacterium]